MRKILTFLLIAVCALGTSDRVRGEASSADDLAYERQQALREYFENNDKIRDFGSKPLELLSNPKYSEFSSRYGDALLVIRVANDFANAQDTEAAKKVAEEVTKKLMEKLAPNFMKVVSWMSWAKTGMELFKVFYFDPALEQGNIERYSNARRDGFEPAEAFAHLRSFGHMRTMALERFRAEYGDGVFEAGSKDKLLPRWEPKLHTFANAWFEAQYQTKILDETREALRAQERQAQASLPGFDQELLDLLRAQREAAEQEPRLPPARPPARPPAPPSFGREEDVQSDADAPSAACRGLLAAAYAALRQQDVARATEMLGTAEGSCAGTARGSAALDRLRSAIAEARGRQEKAEKVDRLCASVDADLESCRFQSARATLNALAASMPSAPCLGRQAEVETLAAQEAEMVGLLGQAEGAAGKSLSQTRGLLAQALTRAPPCMSGAIQRSIDEIDRHKAWEELVADTPTPPPTGKASGSIPDWVSPPTPSPGPAAAPAAGDGTPPRWLNGDSATTGTSRRPEEALDDARRTLDKTSDEEEQRRLAAEAERRRMAALRLEQERIEAERRLAEERRKTADDEQRAAEERRKTEAEQRNRKNERRKGGETLLGALNRALADAVRAKEAKEDDGRTRPSGADSRPANRSQPVPEDTSKQACIDCINSLITGSCYVRTATLAGWGLCLTCSKDGGVDPSNRFLEKNRCPMCADVRWSLCDFKPAPQGCVPNCCPGPGR